MRPEIEKAAEIDELILTAQIRLSAKMAELKASKKTKPYPIKPRYDDVYFEGLKWLDSLAGINNLSTTYRHQNRRNYDHVTGNKFTSRYYRPRKNYQ